MQCPSERTGVVYQGVEADRFGLQHCRSRHDRGIVGHVELQDLDARGLTCAQQTRARLGRSPPVCRAACVPPSPPGGGGGMVVVAWWWWGGEVP